MNIVIIEDEVFAARRLENMIGDIDQSVCIAARLESVKESIAWFKNHVHPDLVLLDIHLDDGLSFSILKAVPVYSHIVFTTATDEIATRAFMLKKIDYLLKPVVFSDLKTKIDTYAVKERPSEPFDTA